MHLQKNTRFRNQDRDAESKKNKKKQEYLQKKTKEPARAPKVARPQGNEHNSSQGRRRSRTRCNHERASARTQACLRAVLRNLPTPKYPRAHCHPAGRKQPLETVTIPRRTDLRGAGKVQMAALSRPFLSTSIWSLPLRSLSLHGLRACLANVPRREECVVGKEDNLI